jgi:hypothetical protein
LISIRNVKENIIKRVRKWLLAKYWYAVSVCSLLQYIFKEYDIQVHKELCYGELNVITRVWLNIAKHIYNIVVHICMYFSYCLLKHLNIIRVITKLPNSEQSYKGKVKTHNHINICDVF